MWRLVCIKAVENEIATADADDDDAAYCIPPVGTCSSTALGSALSFPEVKCEYIYGYVFSSFQTTWFSGCCSVPFVVQLSPTVVMCLI